MNPVLKRILTGLAVGAAVVAAILFAPKRCFAPVCWVLLGFSVIELVRLVRIRLTVKLSLFAAFLAAALTMAFYTIPLVVAQHGNLMLLYIIAIVKFSDVGGFAFGLSSAKLMNGGNHKLCPSISPGKSWEGLLGSVLLSSAVSCVFIPATHFTCGKALAFGAVAALVGTAGDLVESKFKRMVGVKDSSTMKITNGMGGFLDMFDSLLFAPAMLCQFM